MHTSHSLRAASGIIIRGPTANRQIRSKKQSSLNLTRDKHKKRGCSGKIFWIAKIAMEVIMAVIGLVAGWGAPGSNGRLPRDIRGLVALKLCIPQRLRFLHFQSKLCMPWWLQYLYISRPKPKSIAKKPSYESKFCYSYYIRNWKQYLYRQVVSNQTSQQGAEKKCGASETDLSR